MGTVDIAGRAPAEAQTEARAESAGLIDRAALFYCLKIFVSLRLALGLLALLSIALIQPNVGGGISQATTPGWHNILDVWHRWDAHWFIRIATQGYGIEDGRAAFFPLYPLLIRMFMPLFLGSALAAAIFISNVCYLAALYVVHRLTEHEFGDATARRTVLYLALFPTAFFFLAPYSESLFLFLSATSLWMARRGNWLAAGIAALFAAATRSIGVVLVAPLMLEAILQWRSARANGGGERNLVWSLTCSAIAPFGLIFYLAYWQGAAGDWLKPFRAQDHWLREFSWPWETAAGATREAFRWIGAYPGGYHLLDWLVVLPVIAAAVWVAFKVRPTFAVYAWASLLIPLFFVFAARPFMSVSRFAIVIWPLFWAIARFAERWRAHELVVAVSAGGLAVMTLLFATANFVF
ncbi:MAG: mannosyltransferase family protein [Actinomycetota bacterium]